MTESTSEAGGRQHMKNGLNPFSMYPTRPASLDLKVRIQLKIWREM